jgi:hypothetical protein
MLPMITPFSRYLGQPLFLYNKWWCPRMKLEIQASRSSVLYEMRRVEATKGLADEGKDILTFWPSEKAAISGAFPHLHYVSR